MTYSNQPGFGFEPGSDLKSVTSADHPSIHAITSDKPFFFSVALLEGNYLITHHNDYGSYQIAQCVLQGIRQNNLPIAEFIVDDFKGFDPAHPDPFVSFKIPPSSLANRQTPAGN